jgi:hypothetical protein
VDNQVIVAIGDLHGNYNALEEIIFLLNKQFNLLNNGIIAPNATLISTGDSIDRGSNALQIIEYFMRLGKNNPNNFKTLMGNHELLALENFDLAKLINNFENPYLEQYKYNSHGLNGGTDFLREFGVTDKEALNNYIKRMSRTGDIGRWIRTLLPMYETEISDKKILFVHAGIPKILSNRISIDEYIKKYTKHFIADTVMSDSIRKYGDPLITKDGVFWDRSSEKMSESTIQTLTINLGVDFIVTGHTPHKKIEIFGGRIIDIDVGMCQRYGANTPAVLVINKSGISAYYTDGEINKLIKF